MGALFMCFVALHTAKACGRSKRYTNSWSAACGVCWLLVADAVSG